ncbi:DNA/RNA helicase domain-containing protein [Pediococcus damnosus]|uniref:DNA/RNA helicase domain-containing protein n=1 Tax=Pediococcus damnosus TaxID=51663 RepID=UPI0009BFBE57|nr:DNA/RNA helicase domain-containing protein [Pediococcus damnosus]
MTNGRKVTDSEIFKKRDDLTDPKKLKAIKIRLIMNTLNVLLKRGVHGLCIYASQPTLRKRLTQK